MFRAGTCARWYRSLQTTLWGQKLNFSLRNTVEAINWPLASFHCLLAAWVIYCHYFCMRFILRELQGISVEGFRLFLLHFSSRDRILAERTETSAMPRGLWG